jgi:hypothetical protein
MALPFLNWFVDIMLEISPSQRPVFQPFRTTQTRRRRRDIIAQFSGF